MLTATSQTQVGFEMVSKSDAEESRNAAVTSSKRVAKDMTWTNVNYNVGTKKILTDCWGKVGNKLLKSVLSI